MPVIIVKDGNEPQIQQAVTWLESLGIPRDTIVRLDVIAKVGEPLLIRPTLMVPAATEPEPVIVEFRESSRELCPCGAGFQHAELGDQDQHADWIERHNEP